MNSQWRWALPGALVLVVVAGACQDAPLGPRAPADRPAQPGALVHAVAFSGRSSDSLVEQVTAQWASHGHPEYRREIDAWRQRVLGTTRPAMLLDASDLRASPRSAIISGGTDTQKDPPQIMTHREALHFGNYASGFSVPNLLEGEMTFVGDVAKISVGSFSVVANSGYPYTVSGVLATGPGQIVNCIDPTLGCGNTKRLAGSLRLDGTPFCDASASGNLAYAAQNVQTSYSVPLSPATQFSSGDVANTVSVSADIRATAAPCDQKRDSTSTPADPNPVSPYPPQDPWPVPDPGPIDPPPFFAPGPPVVDDCVATFDLVLLLVIVRCSPT